MTYTRSNLAIFKAQQGGDSPDAGGQRTINKVASGVINALFPGLSDIDHAESAVEIAKCFPALDTADTESLIDAHIFISEPPTDPLVTLMIAESSLLDDESRRKDMVDMLESSVRAGQLIRDGLIGLLAGQDSFPRPYLQSMYRFNDRDYWANVTLLQGQIICISVEYEGNEDARYPRFEHFCEIQRTVTGGQEGQVQFKPPIPFDTPDRDVVINGESGCTKLRLTSQNADVKYHGVTRLTAENSSSLLAVQNTVAELLPRVKTAKPHAGLSLSAQGTSDVPSQVIKRVVSLPEVSGQSTYIFDVPDLINTDFVNKVLGLAPKASGIRSSYRWSVSVTGSKASATRSITIGGGVGVAINGVSLEYVSGLRYHHYESSSPLPSSDKIAIGTVIMTITFTNGSGNIVLRETEAGFVDSSGRKFVELDYADGTVTKFPDARGDFTVSFECLAEPGLSEENVAAFNMSITSPIPETFYFTVNSADGSTLLSGSSDAAGVITGNGVTSGSISGNTVQISFAQDVDLTSFRYDVSELVTLNPPPELFGLNPLRLQNAGVVPIFNAWNAVAIQHTQTQIVASPASGQTKNVRAGAQFVDITDAAGQSLWTEANTHYSYDSTTGVVTINSDFAGFTAPFLLTDTIGELAQVLEVFEKSLQLSKPLEGTYPAGAVVASVQKLGSLQARVGQVRDMSSWDDNWNQDGTPATASFNYVDYPIEVQNDSAVNEEWVLIFSSSTTFRCVGKRIGQIATGDTLNDFSPINPLTGKPYFIIRFQAFGGGWQVGEAIRWPTYAASKPAMLIRTTASGHSQIEVDRSVLGFRGNRSSNPAL
ncbi:hypothetical protein MJ923_14755 [Shewanella sp. 3B26]|uniref:Uncharacterized protein n=1 Tax=Shewanella zhuhaiensis TaxID=2919576 RepID=A0AAJ1F0W8_9GAMM|nr:hypothetical protein [Shewanella zhuhaiensis]MCH4295566.1 hypothetical protein [Shewanella zhuhaiensis]